ncbi:hypothetical protein ACFYZ8_33600 [Streptomyces sp. NPDC001668]|uniref:hypothetical protein n=1 Tax=Streptomyces sp. NPDC001668 TaxID=3364598 RepID=UPI00368A8664
MPARPFTRALTEPRTMTQPEHDTDPTRPSARDTGSADRRTGTAGDGERTAAQWRQLLRDQPPPDELADLPWRARRRGRRAWKSARRAQREQWVKAERRKVPTPITIPIIALVLAGAVGLASWLQSGHDHQAGAHPAPSATPTAAAAQSADPATPTPATTASPTTTTRPTTPDGIAKAFVTAYCTRKPLQDGSHKAAVERAAPYASAPLVTNLAKHDDKDFNQLVAAQAVKAAPTTVTISQPAASQRPAPDTAVRVYRQATAVIAVEGTDDYRYTRHLTLEIARADVGQPWMVTRVLGLKE